MADGEGKMVSESTMRAAFSAAMPPIFGTTKLHNLYIDAIKEIGKTETEITEVTVAEKAQGESAQPTNQTTPNVASFLQVLPQAVNIEVIRSMKDISPHHAACIQAKKFSIMGLGFVSEGDAVEGDKNSSAVTTEAAEQKITSLLTGESFVESKIDKMLGPLTLEGFDLELYRAVEDFLDGGTGYLEVVRDKSNKIVGLNWIPYEDLRAATFRDIDKKSRIFYKYQPLSVLTGIVKHYSLFGLNNRQAIYDKFYANNSGVNVEDVSEVIVFKEPSNRSKLYGYPDWLSAASIITLLALAVQYKSDFYTNRGVLSFILSVIGPIDPEKWKDIEDLVQGTVGAGNNFRNMAINVPATEGAKVQIDKLASTDKTELQFSKDSEVYAQQIVSAHRVPPVLANILIPGKLGATNEAVQALITFQLLVIGPKQEIIQKVLSRSLGDKEGVEGLEPEDFRLRKVTSQFDIAGLDTVGKMREEAATATDDDGSSRDVSEGVRD